MFLTTEALGDDQAERIFKDRIKGLSHRLHAERDQEAIAQIVSDATDGTFEHDECLDQLRHYERLVGQPFVPQGKEACETLIEGLVRVTLLPNVRIRRLLEERGGVSERLADFHALHKQRIEGRPEKKSGSFGRMKRVAQKFGIVKTDNGRLTLFTDYNDMLAMTRALGLAPHEVGV